MCRWFDSASRHHLLKFEIKVKMQKKVLLRHNILILCLFLISNPIWSITLFDKFDKTPLDLPALKTNLKESILTEYNPTNNSSVVTTSNEAEKEDQKTTDNIIVKEDSEIENKINESIGETIDERYDNQLKLIYPEPDTLILKPSIQVKGINRFLTKVFVNDVNLRLRKDGRFYHELEIEEYGKQSVYITFLRPDLEPYTVRRKVIRLMSP